MTDRIKVFGVLNHQGHQYELLKLAKKYPVKFCYLLNNVRKWSSYSHRPEPTTWLSPDEFEWVTHYTPGEYDVAILHVDQQHVNPDIGKGWLYRDLDEVIQDIPKIVINHGTPMYAEMYDEDIVINGGNFTDRHGKTIRIKGMKEKIGDNFMVVNSYTANKRWGFGYPIIHGLDPAEWWDLPKEHRVILPLSPGGLDKYYNRELISALKVALPEHTGIDVIHTNVNYEVKDWNDYREMLGTSLISISPYKDSPMPRSRTESMLSGACILTSRYQDVPLFIENGVNGFILPDNPLSYVELIQQLSLFKYKDAVAMGQEAKKTALKYFHIDRWHKDWYELLKEIVAGRKPVWDGKTTIYGKDYE